MALPFLTGFYSKDFILEMALIPHNTTNTMACILALIAALLTGTYSARLMILTFLSEPHFPSTLLPIISDPVISSFISLFIASIAAIFFGYLTNELFMGIGSNFYEQSLFIHPDHLILLDGTLSPASIWKLLPPLTLLTQITLLPLSFTSNKKEITSNINTQITINKGISLNINENISPYHTLSLYSGILNHFNIYIHWIINFTLNLGLILHRHIDRGLIELIGPTGLINLIHYIGFRLELLATGYLPHYAFIILFSILISLIIILQLITIPFYLILLFLFAVICT